MLNDYKMIGADGKEYPGTLEDLRAWIAEGRLGSESWIWKKSDECWFRADQLPELSWDLPQPIPSPPILPKSITAGFVPRLAAYLFDTFVLQLIFMVVLFPWTAQLKEIFELAVSQYDFTNNATPDILPVLKAQLIFMGIYAPISLIYWVGFNGRYGATPGKKMLGIQIVDLEGLPIGYALAFRRYCAEVISLLPLGMGYLMILSSPSRQALHDVMTGTRVEFRSRND